MRETPAELLLLPKWENRTTKYIPSHPANKYRSLPPAHRPGRGAPRAGPAVQGKVPPPSEVGHAWRRDPLPRGPGSWPGREWLCPAGDPLTLGGQGTPDPGSSGKTQVQRVAPNAWLTGPSPQGGGSWTCFGLVLCFASSLCPLFPVSTLYLNYLSFL